MLNVEAEPIVVSDVIEQLLRMLLGQQTECLSAFAPVAENADARGTDPRAGFVCLTEERGEPVPPCKG
jgi:hypothetical protein